MGRTLFWATGDTYTWKAIPLVDENGNPIIVGDPTSVELLVSPNGPLTTFSVWEGNWFTNSSTVYWQMTDTRVAQSAFYQYVFHIVDAGGVSWYTQKRPLVVEGVTNTYSQRVVCPMNSLAQTLYVSCESRDGIPVPLENFTTFSVQMAPFKARASARTLLATVEVVQARSGLVTIQFGAGDVSTSGMYVIQILASGSRGTWASVPILLDITPT